MKMVWKVGRRWQLGEKIVSAFAPDWLKTTYHIGVTAYPPIGYLFAFGCVDGALEFARSVPNSVIMEGEGEVVQFPLAPKVLPARNLRCESTVKSFWEDPQGHLYSYWAPTATVLLASFRPTRIYQIPRKECMT